MLNKVQERLKRGKEEWQKKQLEKSGSALKKPRGRPHRKKNTSDKRCRRFKPKRKGSLRSMKKA